MPDGPIFCGCVRESGDRPASCRSAQIARIPPLLGALLHAGIFAQLSSTSRSTNDATRVATAFTQHVRGTRPPGHGLDQHSFAFCVPSGRVRWLFNASISAMPWMLSASTGPVLTRSRMLVINSGDVSPAERTSEVARLSKADRQACRIIAPGIPVSAHLWIVVHFRRNNAVGTCSQ